MRAFETEKTEVAEIDRSVYDIKDKVNAAFEVNSGLTAEIVEKISEEKHDPEWMRIFRLKALGSLPGRAGHEQHRHLRASQHRNARQVERCARGYQEHV